jgi:peptidoglycan/LPS O-acetylase OafA/YrhL
MNAFAFENQGDAHEAGICSGEVTPTQPLDVMASDPVVDDGSGLNESGPKRDTEPKRVPVSNGEPKIPALDGIRGLAILFVLCVHLQQTGAVPQRYHLLNTVMHAGWCGVDLFFVLSGFLITLGLLDSKGAVNYFSAFYMRRVLRIFPLYYLVLVLAVVASVLLNGYEPRGEIFLGSLGQVDGPLFPSALGWISHIFYVQNWWMPLAEPHSRNVLGHFWSLGVEEQFYLVWPLCVYLLPRNRLIMVAVAICAGVLGLRWVLTTYGVPPETIFRNTLTRSDTLMAGALCAIVVRDSALLARVRRWLPLVAVFGAAYVVAVGFLVKSEAAQVYDTVTFGFTALAMVFGSLVLWGYSFSGTRNPFDRALSIQPLTKLGKYSYGLYVYHLPVVYAAKIWFGPSSWFGRSAFLGLLFCVGTGAVAFAIAIASYEIFEKRFLRLKSRFRPIFAKPLEPEALPAARTPQPVEFTGS